MAEVARKRRYSAEIGLIEEYWYYFDLSKME
jgi:hypothetical protein